MAAPRHVYSLRLDGKRLEAGSLRAVHSYFACYMLILVGLSFLLSFEGVSFGTAFTASLSCLSNVGPGIEAVGPMYNYAFFSAPAKLMLSLAMLTGRLEIFPMLVLFSLIIPGKE